MVAIVLRPHCAILTKVRRLVKRFRFSRTVESAWSPWNRREIGLGHVEEVDQPLLTYHLIAKNKNSKNTKRFKRGRKSRPSHELPQIDINAQMRRTFRFVATSTSGTDIAITDAFLSRVLMSTVSGSTTANELIGGFKIERLQIWFPPSGPQPLSAINIGPAITWLGGGLGTNKVVTCHSLSTAEPAHLDSRPPRNSQAAFWGTGAGNSNTYFYINQATEGAYIDLSLSIKLSVGVCTTTTVASASFSGILYGRLDGASGIWSAITGGVAASE